MGADARCGDRRSARANAPEPGAAPAADARVAREHGQVGPAEPRPRDCHRCVVTFIIVVFMLVKRCIIRRKRKEAELEAESGTH